jgi:hypothetical protein
MYVDRNDVGAIVMAWASPQRKGHELVAIDNG